MDEIEHLKKQAAWTTFVYDLAVTLLACAAPLPDPSLPDPSLSDPSLPDEEVLAKRCGPLLVATARALMAGYQRMRLLTDGEWTALWWALRQACVRFTTTRLTDVHLHTLETARAEAELPPAESPSEPTDSPWLRRKTIATTCIDSTGSTRSTPIA